MVTAIRITRVLLLLGALGQVMRLVSAKSITNGWLMAVYTLLLLVALAELFRRIANHLRTKQSPNSPPALPRLWSL